MTASSGATFAEKRLLAEGFPDFPGALPTNLAEAYAIQLDAIAAWQDDIVGWKVGRIHIAETLGADRFVGPIFAQTLWQAEERNRFPIIEHGFGAFEAEVVVQFSKTPSTDPDKLTPDEILACVGAVHIGVEVASSPLASINDLGPLATTAGFGNNLGIILGPEIPNGRNLAPKDIPCRTVIDGQEIKVADASFIPGGPVAALAFAIRETARLGFPIQAGQWVSTGAITGVHSVTIGQDCIADFGPFGEIHCRTVAAAPGLNAKG